MAVSKEQAIEIRNKALAECSMDTSPEYSRGYDSGALVLFEALASAGAFTDGATVPGEIRHCDACDQYGDPSGVAQDPKGCPGVFTEPSRPVATGSKARAEEILNELPVWVNLETLDAAIDALDRAGFFADEATLAEIDGWAREILAEGDAVGPFFAKEWRNRALALATAVRNLLPGRGTR